MPGGHFGLNIVAYIKKMRISKLRGNWLVLTRVYLSGDRSDDENIFGWTGR